MKNQALFSSKDKTRKLTCRLLQFLFGALRVKLYLTQSSALLEARFPPPLKRKNFFQDHTL